jgi:hypothetical protein
MTEVDGDTRAQPVDPILSDRDMPSLYQAADYDAKHAQTRFLYLQGVEIVLPLCGVALGVVLAHYEKGRAADYLGLAAAGLVALAAVLRVIERTSAVESVWYRSRSCAEAIKALAWRYAVGVSPFPLDATDEATNEAFVAQLRIAAENYPILTPPSGDEITNGMRQLRKQPLGVRIDAYARGRLIDQDRWYARKAIQANAAARRWDGAFYALVGAAVVAGALIFADRDSAAIAVVIAGAAAGAVLTWSSVRRLSSNAHTYRQIATDLSFYRSLVPTADQPEKWDDFVATVEQRIATENQRWQAARL